MYLDYITGAIVLIPIYFFIIRGLNLKSQFNGQNIVVPHSRMQTRNFVIFPLYELNKSWIHPKTKININSLIYQFKNSDFSDIRIV